MATGEGGAFCADERFVALREGLDKVVDLLLEGGTGGSTFASIQAWSISSWDTSRVAPSKMLNRTVPWYSLSLVELHRIGTLVPGILEQCSSYNRKDYKLTLQVHQQELSPREGHRIAPSIEQP